VLQDIFCRDINHSRHLVPAYKSSRVECLTTGAALCHLLNLDLGFIKPLEHDKWRDTIRLLVSLSR